VTLLQHGATTAHTHHKEHNKSSYRKKPRQKQKQREAYKHVLYVGNKHTGMLGSRARNGKQKKLNNLTGGGLRRRRAAAHGGAVPKLAEKQGAWPGTISRWNGREKASGGRHKIPTDWKSTAAHREI